MDKEQAFCEWKSCGTAGLELVRKQGSRSLIMLIDYTLFQQHKIILEISSIMACLCCPYSFNTVPIPAIHSPRGCFQLLLGFCSELFCSLKSFCYHKLDTESVQWGAWHLKPEKLHFCLVWNEFVWLFFYDGMRVVTKVFCFFFHPSTESDFCQFCLMQSFTSITILAYLFP